MRRIVLFFVLILSFWRNEALGQFAVYQWSVEMDNVISNETNDHPRAFLWIPENCHQKKQWFWDNTICRKKTFWSILSFVVKWGP